MTIVVAYTPDQYGAAALALAANEADHRSERMLVVNGSRSALRSDDRTATEEQLDQLRRDVTERGIACDIERVVGPDVGEEILATASRVNASLIVVGIRARTPVGKLLLSSVSQHIILHAECPVLSVKAE